MHDHPERDGSLPDWLFDQLIDAFDASETRAGFHRAVEDLCARHPAYAPMLRQKAAELERRNPESKRTEAHEREHEGEHERQHGRQHERGKRDQPMPEQMGPYRVLSELGEGGMGTVYLAEQKQPMRRRVALKVIKLGMDTKQVLNRFEAERQALAMMEHGSIARVFDGGATEEGRPYFAMEYVKGVPITEYCDEQKLGLAERFELFRQVCAGVQHAHQKGVIHRDLKPNNILVTVQDGKPRAKIIDFGLARATDHRLVEATIFTEHGTTIGTPEYMSPEQAGMTGLDIDTRTDIYSLGVILYELLVGQLPFSRERLRQAGLMEIQRVIREEEPKRPSTQLSTLGDASEVARRRQSTVQALARDLRGDLDWIVLKAMEKDRSRRYENASELAADLHRHLDHEPVLASPPSTAYRLRKLARKYRVQLAAAAGMVVLLLAGVVGTTWGLIRAEASATEARRQEGIAKQEAARAREQQEIAEANAREARRQETVAREAQRQERIAKQETQRQNDMLANVVHLGTAREKEAELYPAWPENATAMESWLRNDAAHLRDALPKLREMLETLRGRAVERTEERVAAARRAHPEHHKLVELRARLASLRRAAAVARGEATAAVPPLPEELATADAQALNSFAWGRVAYPEERERYGEERDALAAAERAVERLEDGKDTSAALHMVLDTLAWAYLAVGRTDDAVAASRRALEAAPEPEREQYAGFLQRVEDGAEALAGENGASALGELEQQIAALEDRIEMERTYRFTEEADRFLFETLRSLIADIEAFEAETRAAVEERLGWAEAVERLTIERFEERWAEARRAILRADGETASALYEEPAIDLAPQMGLVPIGMNPVTKLWEFYHLRSAWDPDAEIGGAEGLDIPEHDEKGHIEVGDRTGIVFVLIPGGTFTMGATKDPAGPNHDPQAQPHESPVHRVTLGPFFLGRHELTQGQWARLSGGQQPSYYAAEESNFIGGRITWAHPVEQVDWTMCRDLLRQHGLLLPTEAQWEYGCRAGTTTPWWSGQERESLRAGGIVANLADGTARRAGAIFPDIQLWPELEDGFVVHAPVGALRPNGWGLHHVHGNVWEWCRDWDGVYTLPAAEGDGLRQVLPGSSALRVHRGGSFDNAARDARSANRGRNAPTFRYGSLGARAARGITTE